MIENYKISLAELADYAEYFLLNLCGSLSDFPTLKAFESFKCIQGILSIPDIQLFKAFKVFSPYNRLISYMEELIIRPMTKNQSILQAFKTYGKQLNHFVRRRVRNTEDAEELGRILADDLLSRGAKEILDEVYGNA